MNRKWILAVATVTALALISGVMLKWKGAELAKEQVKVPQTKAITQSSPHEEKQSISQSEPASKEESLIAASFDQSDQSDRTDQTDQTISSSPSPQQAQSSKVKPLPAVTQVSSSSSSNNNNMRNRFAYELADSPGMKLWQNAELLDFRIETDPETGMPRRLLLLQPADLPYPIRIEEVKTFANSSDGSSWCVVSEIAANRVIAKLSPDRSFEETRDALMSAGALSVEKLTDFGLIKITTQGPSLDAVPEALKKYAEIPLAYAEKDPIVHANLTPNDPLYTNGTLWGMHNTGQNGGVADADIDAPEGWDIRTSAANIVVAVIDTGVRYTHEDIAANMWINPGEDGLDTLGRSKRSNGVDDDGNGYVDDVYGINAITGSGNPMDDQGHGSHCAGTIAGVGNNGKGVVGVAWEAKIMALKFLSSSGSGSVSDAITCINYAISKGAHLTSNSWGGGDYTQALYDAIVAARNAGQLFVVAAANNSSDNDIIPLYPSNYRVENVLSVAALDRTDSLASFSNYGAGSVEVGAPGVAITSLKITSDSEYTAMSGTSMATPHVSGLAALMFAHFPSSNMMGIKNRIMKSGRPVTSIASKTITGRMINVYGALTTTSDAPINDDFDSAILFVKDPGTIRANNYFATTQSGEPSHAGSNSKSIWFKRVAPVNGTIMVKTEGSSFDTTLAVYTGTSVNNLTLIASNDNDGSLTTSKVEFTGIAGTTYYIAVAGKNGAEGFVSISLAGPPEEDPLSNAAQIPTFPFTYESNNTYASRESGEPLHADQPGGGSLWLKFNSSTLGIGGRRIVLTARGSTFDTLLAVYKANTATPTFADLIPVVSNDNAPYGNTQSEVSFYVEPATNYFIAIDGKNNSRGIAKLAGFFKSANDDFADAIVISGLPISVTAGTMDLYYATREAGEPSHDNAGVGKSLWYNWTAPSSGDIILRTNANTALGIYTGNAINALTLAAPDQNSGSSTSYAVLSATSGTTYRIAIDLRSASSIPPDTTLTIEAFTPAPHDNLIQAYELIGTPTVNLGLTFEGSNVNATLENGEPTGPGEMNRTVWLKWTATTTSGTALTADTHLSKINSTLAIYRLTSEPPIFDNLSYVAGDKDGGIDDDAWIKFNAMQGTTYYFQIGSSNAADQGDFKFHLNVFVPVPNDNFANAEELTNFFIQREIYNFGASRETGEPNHVTNDAFHNNYYDSQFEPTNIVYNTVWFKWTPTADQIRRTSASSWGSNMRSVVAVYETTSANPTFSDLSIVNTGASKWFGPGAYPWWAWGEVNWVPQLGKTYYIVIGPDSQENEIMRLSLWQNPNDNFANRETLPSVENVSRTTANFAATVESGEPKIVNNGGRSVWYQWTAPTTGRYIIDTFDSYLTDRFTALGLREDGYNNVHMQLGIYTGSAVNALTKIATVRDISMRNYNAMLTLDAIAGQTYQFVIDTEVGPSVWTSSAKTPWCYRAIFNINITKADGKLSNDNLADAKRIEPGYSEFIDLKYATREPGEPSHGSRATRSAWWKWTAPVSGTYWVATTTDIFDSQHTATPGIAVYSGPEYNVSFASLTKKAENAGSSEYSYYPAKTSFSAVAGTTYYFAVDLGNGTNDYHGYRTGFSLVPPAPNDNFANATVITGSRRTVTGNNISATAETGEPKVCPEWFKDGATQSSVWWRWTAPANGSTTITTYGSYLVPELAVYTGDAVNNLTQVVRAISDSFENGFTYEERQDMATCTVIFNAIAGTTYHILVTGSGWDKQSRGLITLTVTGQPGKPLTPTNLRAIRVSQSRVDLTWTDEAVDESTYVIQRATSQDGPWSAVFNSGEPNTTAWSDLDATVATLFYRVRAEGPGGIGDWAYASTDDNYPPSISTIPDQIITKNTSSDPIPFTVTDDYTAPESLIVTATSSNTTKIPNSNLVIGGSGANRTITITPAANQIGAVVITVTVNDGSLSTQRTFNVVISDPNELIPTAIRVTPASALLSPSGTQQFTALLRDQWGNPFNPQPESFTWNVIGANGGNISSTGLLTTGTTPGDYQITASASSVTGTAYFTILGNNIPGAGNFSDSFNDGNRTDGTDPNDVNWYYQKASSGLTIGSDGGLTNALTFNSNNNNASFFAKLPNSPITLVNTGDYIELSFKYSRTGTTQNYDSGTRVGLFFQSNLPSADNYGTAVAPMWDFTGLDAAVGYLVGFPSGSNSKTNIRKDDNSAPNNSSTTTNNYLIHATNTTTGLLGTESTDTGLKIPNIGSAGLPATIRFKIEKIDTGVRVTAGLTPNGGTETTIVRDDTNSPYLTFNAIAFGSASINQVNYYDDIVVTANVEQGTVYTLTYAAGPGGSISGTSPQNVIEGGSGTPVTAVPDTGYHFVRWSDDRTDNPRTDTNVTSDINVTAIFEITTYTVTFQTDGTPGATLTGQTSQTVNHGANCSAVTANAPSGYSFVNWTKGGTEYSTNATIAPTGITETMTFIANFAEISPGKLQIASANYSVSESGGTVTVYVTRTNGISGAVGVSYATANGTAIAGSDYTAKTGTLSWNDHDSSAKEIQISITPDNLVEGDETFTVSISNPTGGATLGTITQTTVTITDDDYTLTVSNNGNGSTTPSGATVQTKGANVGISATPNSGYHFANWTLVSGSGAFGDANSANTTFTSSVNSEIRANFAENQPEIVVSRSGTTINNNGTDNIQTSTTGVPVELTYTIANTGLANLVLGSASLSDLSNVTANVQQQPSSPVTPSGNTTLVVLATPSAAGAWSVKVSFTTNDNDENPTSWTISGMASGSGSASFTDSFDDGKRVNRDNPDSHPQWFYQKSSTQLTVADGAGLVKAVNFSSNSSPAGSFFAALPVPVTLTNEGDYLEVSFKYARSATTSYNSGTRVGFFSQSGLPTADNYGTATASPWDMVGFDSAVGYLAGFASGNNSNSNIRKDNNSVTDKTRNYLVHAQNINDGILGTTSSDAGLKVPDAGTIATIRFRIEKITSGVRITAGMKPAGGNETTFQRDDTSSPYYTFNAIAFGMAYTNQINYYDDIVVSTNVSGGTPPQITSAPPPNGTVGVSYSHNYTATGTEPITFSLTSGTLPTGLQLSSNGLLSGTPTQDGTFTGTVSASNGILPNATQDFSITISLPTFTVNFQTDETPGATLTGDQTQYIQLGGTCSEVTANAPTGYEFVNWTKGGVEYSTNATIAPSDVTENMTFTANFELIPVSVVTSVDTIYVPEGGTETFQVKLSTQPTTNVTVTVSRTAGDADITVESGSSLIFTPENWDIYQTVTLAAADDSDANNGTATITCDANESNYTDKNVTAIEIDKHTTLTVTNDGNCTTTPSGAVVVQKNVATAISATPNEGYTFATWTTVSGSANFADASSANTVVSTGVPSTIRANCQLKQYTLTYAAGANGSISGTSPQYVNHGGSSSPVTAVPNSGYRFVKWSDDRTDNPRTDTNVTANINVTAIFALNQPPVITEGESVNVNMSEDGSPTAFSLTLNATDADDPGTALTWSIQTQATNGTASASGTGSSKAIGYTPNANWNGSDSFIVKVEDPYTGYDTITVNVTVEPVNDAPVVANPIPDQQAIALQQFTYQFPIDTFNDIEDGTSLTYAATKSDDSPLPSWLSFNPSTRVFSGTPQISDIGTVLVKVTATDSGSLSASDTFDINVLNVSGTKYLENDFETVTAGNYAGTSGAQFGTDTLLGNATGAIISHTVSSTGGVNNSKVITSSDPAVRSRNTFDIRSDKVKFSAYFKFKPYSSTLTGGFMGLGYALTAGADNVSTWSAGESDRLLLGLKRDNSTNNTVSIVQMGRLGSTAAVSGGQGDVLSADFTVDKWYQISFQMIFNYNSGAPANSTITVENFIVRDWGMDGLTGGNTVLSLASTTFNHNYGANLNTSHIAYGIIIGNRDRGGQYLDNMLIETVPNIVTYTLTYDGNGAESGTVPAQPTQYVEGATVTVLGNTGNLTKTGYTFSGWNTAADGSGISYQPGATFTITANTTLYAQWTVTYTLTYLAGEGGSISGTSPQIVAHGGNGTPVTAVPNDGYYFVKWSDESTANPRTDTNVTGNITVTAIFAINVYTVTFNLDGKGIRIGGGELEQQVNHGSSAVAPIVQGNNGWIFTGWDKPFNNITENTIITALYSAGFTVNFVTDGTTGAVLVGETTQNVADGADCTPVAALAPKGYRFVSWFMDGQDIMGNPLVVKAVHSNKTATAKFAKKRAIDDFNNDGRADVISEPVVSPSLNSNIYLINATEFSFIPPIGVQFYQKPSDTNWQIAKFADLTGDNRCDLLWRNVSTGKVLLNTTQESGSALNSGLVVYSGGAWAVVDSKDFNNDGKDDILWRYADATTAKYMVNFMNGGAVIGSRTISKGSPDWVIVKTADFNGDSMEDVLYLSTSTKTGIVYFLDRGAVLGTAKVFEKGTGWDIKAIGDFDKNGATDILLESTDGKTGFTVLLKNRFNEGGSGVKTSGISYSKSDVNWKILQSGDFDNDGKDDLLWENSTTGQGMIWVMNGITASSNKVIYTLKVVDPAKKWTVKKLLDVNADGKADILWYKADTGKALVYLMNGTTIQSTGTIYTPPTGETWKVVNP